MERQPRKRKRVQHSVKIKAVVPNEVSIDNRAAIPDKIVSIIDVGQTSVEDTSGTDKMSLVGEKAKMSSLPRCNQSASSSSCRERSRSTHQRSPSPARFYREREQSELQNLNDRLSSHVENVKQLQSENARLKIKIKGMDVISQEMKTMKKLHGVDIEMLQELLDTARKEKSRMEQSLESMSQEMDKFRDTLAEKTEEIMSLERSMENLHIVSKKYDEQQDELKILNGSLQEKEADVMRLSDELVKVKVANKRLEEESQRNKSLYMNELEQASTRMNQHFENYDQTLEAGYEVMVSDAMTSVREQHIRDLAALKEELTTLYQTKLVEWKSKAERANADLLATKKDLKASKSEQDNLRSQTIRFKMDAAALKVQFEEEQTKYQDLNKEAEKDRCQLQREMVLLKQELSEVREELEEVGGANMRLEQEITTYRVILDDLESKSPFCSPTRRSKKSESDNESPSRAVMSDADMNNDMQEGQRSNAGEYLRTNEVSHGIGVEDVDPDGRYISLVNKADHLVDMCLWTVKQSSSNRSQVQFEVPYSTPLAAGQRLTIWSQGQGPFVDKTNSDAILSLADPRNTRDVFQTVSPELGANINDAVGDLWKPFMDTLHINIQGKHWLQRPPTMNVRLQDGDGQLQAKCTFTSHGHLLETVALDEPEARSAIQRLTTMLPFYTNDSVDDERERSVGARGRGDGAYMQTYKRRHVPKRKHSACASVGMGDQPMMSKDGCLTM